jgi:hypothetical protein
MVLIDISFLKWKMQQPPLAGVGQHGSRKFWSWCGRSSDQLIFCRVLVREHPYMYVLLHISFKLLVFDSVALRFLPAPEMLLAASRTLPSRSFFNNWFFHGLRNIRPLSMRVRTYKELDSLPRVILIFL